MFFVHRSADLIVEVAHPSVSVEYGALFLKSSDFMVCSVVDSCVFFNNSKDYVYIIIPCEK